MNKNMVIYQRVTVLDDILEIAIPKTFDKVTYNDVNKNVQNCVVWIKENNEVICIYRLESNQYALRDIMEASRIQMVTEEQEIKNLGVYSCERDGIEKFMSEDEVVVDGMSIYIISCVLRCKDMSYVIYYSGSVSVKSSIKESMLYVLDTISFNIER